MNKKKFGNARYVTRGINSCLGFYEQNLFWRLIDELNVDHDYLQVFKLSCNEEGTTILHKQEEPSYAKEYKLRTSLLDKKAEDTIFVIDNGEYSTMMFANEY